MEYANVSSGKKKISAINVTHRGKVIVFNGMAGVNGGDSNQDLFEFVNEFFASCSDAKLDELWGELVKAKTIMEPGYFGDEETESSFENRREVGNYLYLTEQLKVIVKRVYEIIKPQEIAYAAQISGRTLAPRDLMVMASLGDYPEETTINNEKYSELVKLAFTAQISYPIFHELLNQVYSVTGKDYQYAVAGSIIPFVGCLTILPGWKIMDTYIRASCARQEPRRNTLEVVSDARYVDHIIYRGLFTKLCMSFIPSKIKDKNLSKELNSLVEGEIRRDQSVKFNTFDKSKPGSEEQSIPESYRIAQAVNAADELAQCEFFTFGMFDENDNPRHTDFFKYQCEGLDIQDHKTAERIFDSLPTIWNFRFTNIHNKLLGLVFRRKVNYYLYPAMDYRQLMAAISLAQQKLFEMGFEHLAQLCGVIRNASGPMTYMADEFKLNATERDQLCQLCYVYDGQSQASTDNLLVMDVQSFLDELSSSSWESNIEPGLLGNPEFVSAMSPGDMYPVELVVDIKHELLKLVNLMHTTTTTIAE
jgi:hypothetical protein